MNHQFFAHLLPTRLRKGAIADVDRCRPPGPRSVKMATGLLLLSCFLTNPTEAAELGGDSRFKLSADFRLRFEADWDSQTAGGEKREDRNRARVRARVGLTFSATQNFELAMRLRSGSDFSQQSPHVTVIDFDGNDTGDADFNLDKWYVKAKKGGLSWWAGRNSFPFWKQNEFLWDDDATLAGLAGAFTNPVGNKGKLTLNLAYLSLPVGMQEFSGNLAGGQIVYARSGDLPFTLAAGYLDIDSNPDDRDAAALLLGNGSRDYQILVGNFRVESRAGERPLVFGLDFMHNAKSYSANDPDPFTAANRGQTDGFVFSAEWGQTGSKGDWRVGYSYARIATFAVNASYSQDDWIRWGSSNETRSSNFQGHELRYVHELAKWFNLVARLYIVEAITTAEDGNRFRIDFNYKL